MNLREVKTLIDAQVLWGENVLDKEISHAFGCDLLSDVLAFTPPNVLLLTGLTNVQVVYTAEMIDAAGIVFVRGKRPPVEVIDFAMKKGIPLLATCRMLYDCCGILYQNGLKGCEKP